MDTVTYPDKAVVRFIHENMIPVKIQYDHQPYSGRFNVKWTPTLIVLDDQGSEVYRNSGFLGPKDLIPALMLGTAKTYFGVGQYEKAAETFDLTASKFPESEEAPEAIYYSGAARFKATKDRKALTEMYKKLSAKYPRSSWMRKAAPYRP